LPDGLLVGFAFNSNATGLGAAVRTFANLNLRVVNVHQQLAEVAHVEQRPQIGEFPQ
jgi:hypothetical protein